MKINIKKNHPNAVIPKCQTKGSAGMDLTAVDMVFTDDYIEYDTGLSVAIPEGYVGIVAPRSSISKMGHSFANSVGIIDSDYRGSIKVRMRFKVGKEHYKVGDRIAQLIIMPYQKVSFEEVEELDKTDRGDGGFGSTGVTDGKKI